MNTFKELLSRSNVSFSEILFDMESSTNEMDATVFVSLYAYLIVNPSMINNNCYRILNQEYL